MSDAPRLPKIIIVDSGVANVRSVANMLEHMGYLPEVSTDAADLEGADRVILPGVGAWDAGVAQLDRLALREPLRRAAVRGVPVLGICLGMQLLFERSEEGSAAGLGWFQGSIVRMPDSPSLKVPHMGWNEVIPTQDDPVWNPRAADRLFDGLDASNSFYFVHSYQAVCEPALVLGTAQHGTAFPAVVRKGSVYGAQFHPEKSHKYGMRFLKNFVELGS